MVRKSFTTTWQFLSEWCAHHLCKDPIEVLVKNLGSQALPILLHQSEEIGALLSVPLISSSGVSYAY